MKIPGTPVPAPLGPPPILTPPSGLLGLLGLKSGGRQPSQFANVVSPTLDLSMFYRAGLRNQLTTWAGLAAVYTGSVILAKVPPNQVWIVDTAFLQSSVLGAVAGVIMTLWLADAGGNPLWQAQTPLRGLTGEDMSVAIAGPIVMLPGYQVLGFMTAAAAPTAFTYFGNLSGVSVAA
jgi:hypothetical protein